jgi:integrase/recombinase XerD
MSEKPISPLRRRMIEDMSVRNFVEKTRNDYIRHVRTSQPSSAARRIRSVAALRFFFIVTLDRPEMARHLTLVREPHKIPVGK